MPSRTRLGLDVAVESITIATNVASPLNTWSNLGTPIESPAGTFTFTDLQATNYPQRFYRVQSP